MLKFIDLFCGLGGFHLSIKNACDELHIPCECVFACDLKENAKTNYSSNFNIKPNDDITKIKTKDIPAFDLLCAGFPCQPFSCAGNRLGFDDIRGTLFFEIARILKEKQPQYFILENVEGLVSHNKGKTFQTILEILKEELKYNVEYNILNACDYGLCQSRKRIYIVGSKDSLPQELFLSKYESQSIFSEIKDENNENYLINDFTSKLLNNYKAKELYGKSINDKRGGENNIHSWNIKLRGEVSDIQKEILTKILQERRKRYIANEQGLKWTDGVGLTKNQLINNTCFTNIDNELNDLVSKHYLKYDYPKVHKQPLLDKEKVYDIPTGKLSFPITYIIDNNGVVPTLTATDLPHIGVACENGIRQLSKNELKKLFGFNENYNIDNLSINECYDLFGNTICVNVVENIMFNILKNNDFRHIFC